LVVIQHTNLGCLPVNTVAVYVLAARRVEHRVCVTVIFWTTATAKCAVHCTGCAVDMAAEMVRLAWEDNDRPTGLGCG
jgi:hypothetical protein